MHLFQKSHKLDDVCYDIRGPILHEANRLEEEGHKIFKLNIGNPAPFGFDTPEEILQDIIHNLPDAQGYADSKGLYSARKAVMQRCQELKIQRVHIDDIYLGNGVSELIVMSMQALINNGDEVLIPAPDYPLWTAAVTLSGGAPVHYYCDEQSRWFPDLEDIKSKISKKTKAIVIINPNNPTGSVYSKEILEEIIELARINNLIIYSDEIYDKIVYDDAVHIPIASLADDVLFITFNGLSKVYRAAGFRCGWLIVSGNTSQARDYIEGLDMLASMRLCSNVISQFAVQTALGGYQSIFELVAPDGAFTLQRNYAWELLNQIPGVSCVKPEGALYLFPRLDPNRFHLSDDEKMVLDLLLQEHILVVQGSAFSWKDQNHFRIVFLPRKEDLKKGIDKIAHFLEHYSQ
jgi:alanine-synthesizing transaminase